jgi:hypothetical protein
MSWSTGSEILAGVFNIVLDRVIQSERQQVAEELIELFENYDCDTIYELQDDFPEVREYFLQLGYDTEDFYEDD